MYKCRECGAIFEEPVYETVCFEEIYGVGSMFMDRHYEAYKGYVAFLKEK